MQIRHETQPDQPNDFTIMVTLPTGETVDLLTESGVPILGSQAGEKEEARDANSN